MLNHFTFNILLILSMNVKWGMTTRFAELLQFTANSLTVVAYFYYLILAHLAILVANITHKGGDATFEIHPTIVFVAMVVGISSHGMVIGVDTKDSTLLVCFTRFTLAHAYCGNVGWMYRHIPGFGVPGT